MHIIDPLSFTGSYAWQALDIANISGATVRLHWADKPYLWHKNEGDEVFIVLDGQVVMYYRIASKEHSKVLNPGDICYLQEGDEHVAHPQGPARILVIEKAGSI